MNTVINFIIGSMLGYLVVKEITKDPHLTNHENYNGFTGLSSLHTSKSFPFNRDHNTKNIVN